MPNDFYSIFSFNSNILNVFSPSTLTIGFYELGLNKISMKSCSSLPDILICASHFILSGFQKARTASPCGFLLVMDAKCLVSLPPEKATPTHELKLKSPVY